MKSIENYKVSDLKEIAKRHGYSGYTKMKKLVLYNFLREKELERPELRVIERVITWEDEHSELNLIDYRRFGFFVPSYKVLKSSNNKLWREYRISGIEGMYVSDYLEYARSVYEELDKPDNFKVQLILWTEWEKDGVKIDKVINSKMIAVYQNADTGYIEGSESINNQLQLINFPKSGFKYKKILYMDVNFSEIRLIRGSSYVELVKWIRDKKAIINPKNEDNQCFKWAVIAALYKYNNIKDLKRSENKFNWSGLTFPMEVSKIGIFEKNNKYGINVIYVNGSTFAILRKSKRIKDVINLFYSDEHYSAINSLSRLLSNTKHNGKEYFCMNCLNGFNSELKLKTHEIYCINGTIVLTKPRNKIMKYTDGDKQFRVPFIIYGDFECIIDSSGNHIPSGFCTYTKFAYGKLDNPMNIYRGKDCVEKFIINIRETVKYLYEKIPSNVEMIPLNDEELELHENAKVCEICKKPFGDKENRKVRDHCHYTGKYRCAAHNKCNFSYSIPKFIPVAFHNLSGYDMHLFINEISKHFELDEISCLAESREKYISTSVYLKVDIPYKDGTFRKKINIRFIDTMRFMQSSLANLVDSMDSFKILGEYLPVDLMKRKGVYPYEYMNSFERFDEDRLPGIDKFYSSLNKKSITIEEYDYAKKVWNELGCETMGAYHNVYLLTDTLLLADVFESFRDTCLKVYNLDPAHFYTAPGLAFKAALKYSGIKLELLQDVDMFLMFENGIRGGIVQCVERHAEANNKYMDNYDSNKDSSYIVYLDANNLYGSAMSEPLPYGGFKWLEPEGNWYNKDKGYLLDVDIEYPRHLDHSDFPFLAERMNINGVNKLVPNMLDKKNYIVHYKTLMQAVSYGIKVIKYNRILEFDEKPWLKGYIDLNTKLRTKATNDFEKNFYKLMNNSVFGKTMENVRNHKNLKLVTNDKKFLKYSSKPNYKGFISFSDKLVGMDMGKTQIVMDKPIYVGQAILDLSKIIMYEFHYNYAKRKWNDIKLLYQDTDSLVYKVKTDDFYKDISSRCKE